MPAGRFPAVDTLMQAWPEELEPLVRALRRPDSHVDVDMATLAHAVCNVLDIPVYANPVESLHCLFTLFLEMRANPMLNPPEVSAQGMTDLKLVNWG